ncbi:MAG: hypothetical protein QM767_09940 [Anaeromyxobacter sp.]
MPPTRLIGSLNGDGWRAREWGLALTRLPAHVRETPLLLPATSLGELGTAFPLTAAVLAHRAIARRYAGGGSVLVWAGGDDGAKGALIVAGA